MPSRMIAVECADASEIRAYLYDSLDHAGRIESLSDWMRFIGDGMRSDRPYVAAACRKLYSFFVAEEIERVVDSRCDRQFRWRISKSRGGFPELINDRSYFDALGLENDATIGARLKCWVEINRLLDKASVALDHQVWVFSACGGIGKSHFLLALNDVRSSEPSALSGALSDKLVGGNDKLSPWFVSCKYKSLQRLSLLDIQTTNMTCKPDFIFSLVPLGTEVLGREAFLRHVSDECGDASNGISSDRVSALYLGIHKEIVSSRQSSRLNIPYVELTLGEHNFVSLDESERVDEDGPDAISSDKLIDLFFGEVRDSPARQQSPDTIEAIANRLRRELGISRSSCPDLIAVMKSLTNLLGGLKVLCVEDSELNEVDAWADCHAMTIAIKESIFEALACGEHRARLTVAHEIGHIALSYARGRSIDARPAGYTLVGTREHEADARRFAVAFLAPLELVIRCETVEEIEKKFCITREAAESRVRDMHLYLKKPVRT
jgi:Zn-dependent peptidase ImmA (M78 family)